ncbi:MAG TPA: hypothetical protein PKD55_21390 [Bellilinea sp.]|nr:hypothetical protein [Bellilinea sp.]
MKQFFLLIGFMCLTGCATPAYKMTDTDLVWEEKVVAAPLQVVYDRLISGFRDDDQADPAGAINPDTKEAVIDIYLRGYRNTIAPWTIGIIKLTPVSDSKTLVRAGINEGNLYFYGKGYLRQEWLAIAAGAEAGVNSRRDE